MSGSTNRIFEFLSLRESERHKGINITKIDVRRKVGKECEVKLDRKMDGKYE